MSFTTLGTTETADSAANNDDDGISAPHPVTGRYLSLQAHLGLLKDAIGAHSEIGMDDSDLPPVKLASAIEDALYNRDGCLGEQQKETPYTTSQFKDTYDDSITTPHDDLTTDERTELKELFRDSENHDVENVKGKFKLPVINGDRLPLLVADEDVLSEAMDMVDEIVDEGNDAPSTTSDVESEVDFPVLEGTLDDLEAHLAGSTPDEETLREMLEVEKDGKDRKGGRTLLEDALEARSTTDDETDEDGDSDDDASSTTDDIDTEELATTVATAVVEALDN